MRLILSNRAKCISGIWGQETIKCKLKTTWKIFFLNWFLLFVLNYEVKMFFHVAVKQHTLPVYRLNGIYFLALAFSTLSAASLAFLARWPTKRASTRACNDSKKNAMRLILAHLNIKTNLYRVQSERYLHDAKCGKR